jgi:hypothetical protein
MVNRAIKASATTALQPTATHTHERLVIYIVPEHMHKYKHPNIILKA